MHNLGYLWIAAGASCPVLDRCRGKDQNEKRTCVGNPLTSAGLHARVRPRVRVRVACTLALAHGTLCRDMCDDDDDDDDDDAYDMMMVRVLHGDFRASGRLEYFYFINSTSRAGVSRSRITAGKQKMEGRESWREERIQENEYRAVIYRSTGNILTFTYNLIIHAPVGIPT